MIEIKAPNTATHFGYLVSRRVPHGAARRSRITSGSPARFELVIERLHREQLDIVGYERAARVFLAEVRAEVEPLEGLRPIDFFRRAPVDIARHVLGACRAAVDARAHERYAASMRPPVQPRLAGVE